MEHRTRTPDSRDRGLLSVRTCRVKVRAKKRVRPVGVPFWTPSTDLDRYCERAGAYTLPGLRLPRLLTAGWPP